MRTLGIGDHPNAADPATTSPAIRSRDGSARPAGSSDEAPKSHGSDAGSAGPCRPGPASARAS
ncbi:hypothetical protein DFS55_15740 [Mycobacterium avium subsp. hominissuis]|uniref:Uncharacterized protein n=1 Tax=Mycobacterium avium subsp. hominissuis TaxID=439334 RepID=A0A3B6X9B0_MYCAV|nr:hypothetical protein DFS55_15740 [Mycobacterium avium subsp. hominissuis]